MLHCGDGDGGGHNTTTTDDDKSLLLHTHPQGCHIVYILVLYKIHTPPRTVATTTTDHYNKYPSHPHRFNTKFHFGRSVIRRGKKKHLHTAGHMSTQYIFSYTL